MAPRRLVKMHGSEFVRNFLRHVVPGGVSRIRYAGIFRPKVRKGKLALCRQLLEASSIAKFSDDDSQALATSASSQEEFQLPEEMISFSEACESEQPSNSTRSHHPLASGEAMASSETVLREARRLPTCKRCGTPEMIPEGFQNWMETRDSIRQADWLMLYFAVVLTTLDDVVALSKSIINRRRGQMFFSDWFLNQRFTFTHTVITIDPIGNPLRPILHNACTFDSLDPSLPLPNW